MLREERHSSQPIIYACVINPPAYRPIKIPKQSCIKAKGLLSSTVFYFGKTLKLPLNFQRSR